MATKLSIAKKIFVLEKDTILNSDSFNNFFTENEVIHIVPSYILTKIKLLLHNWFGSSFYCCELFSSPLKLNSISLSLSMCPWTGLAETLRSLLFSSGFL